MRCWRRHDSRGPVTFGGRAGSNLHTARGTVAQDGECRPAMDRAEEHMRPSLLVTLGASALLACAVPTEPPQPLDGVWQLDSASAGVPPRTMTLTQRGSSITGTGSAMGVDVPIPIGITGTYLPPTASSLGSVTLRFTFENGGGLTADFVGTLSASDHLEGSVVYYGITDVPVTGTLSFNKPAPAESLATGLQGTVRRGPIQPVCQVDVPCDAPFSADFQVRQEQVLVARFRSDSAGAYRVRLYPGTYTVAADSGAPIWPQGQSRQVTVGPVGMTHLDIALDTGIR